MQLLRIATWCCMFAQEEATSGDVWALTALAGGLVAASCCLWYYSRRYVGEMALMMPDAERVRFSVLDFWGNREVRSVRFVAAILWKQSAIGGPQQMGWTCRSRYDIMVTMQQV
jgi:hypothetical protein